MLIPPLSLLESIFRNFGVGADLSGVVTSWLSLKPHLECFTNPYHIYKKCFCTLIGCEWVYSGAIRSSDYAADSYVVDGHNYTHLSWINQWSDRPRTVPNDGSIPE